MKFSIVYFKKIVPIPLKTISAIAGKVYLYYLLIILPIV